MIATAESWVAEPLRQFVADARVHFAIALESNGRVLGQYGFTRSVDVAAACSLAAAIVVTGAELGRLVQGRPLGDQHHDGGRRQLFLGTHDCGGRTILLMAAFDEDSSLGLVRVFKDRFWRTLDRSVPPVEVASPIAMPDLEAELGHNLAVLFGRV